MVKYNYNHMAKGNREIFIMKSIVTYFPVT